jgi:hypothetical protein
MLKTGKLWWLGSSGLLALVLAAGCSRPLGTRPGDAGNLSPEKKLPFHQDAGASATSDGTFVTQSPSQSSTASGVPFRTPVLPSLPVGTLLTVRLGDAVSSAHADAHKVFSGVVEEPVAVDGSVLIPTGAGVQGRVEAARSSDGKRNKGYVRVTLDAVTIDGRTMPLHTASLFARGSGLHTSGLSATSDERAETLPRVVRLEKGRRLIFRLLAPVPAVSADLEITRGAAPRSQ